MSIFVEVLEAGLQGLMIGKLFLAVAALNAAEGIGKGDLRVLERVRMLRGRVGEVELNGELKGVMEEALRKLEGMQNGI